MKSALVRCKEIVNLDFYRQRLNANVNRTLFSNDVDNDCVEIRVGVNKPLIRAFNDVRFQSATTWP